MTPTEFIAALATLGISARQLAAMIGRHHSTVHNWTRPNTRAGGATPIPRDVADWLRRQVAHRVADPAPWMGGDGT